MRRPLTRRTAAVAAPVLAACAVLATAAGAVALLGSGRAVDAAAVVALLAVAAAAAATTATALVVRRRLGELRHLPDLGRRFVTNHDHGTVTGLSEEPGTLTVHLACEQVQTVVMDESGAPDHLEPASTEPTRWQLSTARLAPEQVRRLKRMLQPGTDASVTVMGTVGIAGPVGRRWRLTTPDGLTISAGRG